MNMETIERDIVEEQKTQEAPKSAEEKSQSAPAGLFSKAKSVLKGLRKPKFITLAILLITLAVSLLALNLMSKKEEVVESFPQAQVNSPSPQGSADPTVENIAQKVKTYNEKLDNLDNYQKKLSYPIVNLDISFEKE